MAESISTGPRKKPESEKKFGARLAGSLALSPDEAVNVVVGSTGEADDELLEAISNTLDDDSARRVVEGLLAVTVSPPDIRQKLTDIAANEQVQVIEVDEPLMPIGIPESHFR